VLYSLLWSFDCVCCYLSKPLSLYMNMLRVSAMHELVRLNLTFWGSNCVHNLCLWMVVQNRLLVCWNEEFETWNYGLCAWTEGSFCYSRLGEQGRSGANSRKQNLVLFEHLAQVRASRLNEELRSGEVLLKDLSQASSSCFGRLSISPRRVILA